jgi:hypothetical protein
MIIFKMAIWPPNQPHTNSRPKISRDKHIKVGHSRTCVDKPKPKDKGRHRIS